MNSWDKPVAWPRAQVVVRLQVASQMAGNGIPTTIVCPEPHLLARLFTPKVRARAVPPRRAGALVCPPASAHNRLTVFTCRRLG